MFKLFCEMVSRCQANLMFHQLHCLRFYGSAEKETKMCNVFFVLWERDTESVAGWFAFLDRLGQILAPGGCWNFINFKHTESTVATEYDNVKKQKWTDPFAKDTNYMLATNCLLKLRNTLTLRVFLQQRQLLFPFFWPKSIRFHF